MRDVYRQRSQIEFYKVMAIVAAAAGDKSRASSNLQKLIELMFPGAAQSRIEREERMAHSLQEESGKDYFVREVKYTDGR